MSLSSYRERLQFALERNCICLGLDPVIDKLPQGIARDPSGILKFNRQIIDATHDLVGAFKPNFAFYEAWGAEGWSVLEKTVRHIREISKDVIIIADAKRGDIGNTSSMYAQAVFEGLGADAMTVSPYMGSDSVLPYIERPDKGIFVLALTSNTGASDFQRAATKKGKLYELVIEKALQWNKNENVGLVVGATNDGEMFDIREKAKSMSFLIPGIGTQGGNLTAAVKANFNGQYINAFLNSSRAILYASGGPDFAQAARQSVVKLGSDIRKIVDGK